MDPGEMETEVDTVKVCQNYMPPDEHSKAAFQPEWRLLIVPGTCSIGALLSPQCACEQDQ